MEFSQDQKKIAHEMFLGPKTIEEISRKAGLSQSVVSKELKELIKLNFVAVSGYPSKYYLKKEIQSELERRKEISLEDKNMVRLKAIIEVQALLEESALKSLKEVENALRADTDFTIYDISIAKPLKQEEKFSSYLEANLSVRDFKALVKLMYFFGPTSVEVLKPAKIEVLMADLQEGLMEMAEMIQAYNYYIIKLMNKKEIETFQKQLFGNR
ncbi:MAG: ArsR family transcriptional regulator [Candidatus Diapherotrites archaeon]|nr:ArsR family transcriptional regulator [Candidatus Diapherotrites archaeon]